MNTEGTELSIAMTKGGLSPSQGDSLVYAVVEIDANHPVPRFWNSTDSSTGYARILIDKNSLQIVRMEMAVDGVFLANSGNVLQNNIAGLQPFHFHNKPQGGPDFFVQQLFDVSGGSITTAALAQTDSGFSFKIDSPYTLRRPVNNPGNSKLSPQFVVDEILDGNSYLGIHTEALKIPATALAGDLRVLADGSINGSLLWLEDGDDVGSGKNLNDLISLGAGNDRGIGGNGDDVLDGGAGDDVLLGNREDDSLWGGNGNDTLIGGAGNDQLFGARGDDLLIGGSDNDELSGGLGADVFGFGPQSGKDVITDFVLSEDTIELVGGQKLISTELANLGGGGAMNDTLLKLTSGEISVLDADLTAAGGWLM